MRIRLQLSAIFLILCAPLFSEQRRYSITDLGDGTNQFSVPYAMNNLGDVVGDANFHACFWMRGIIVIPPSLATGFSTARGINNRRQVVGGHVNASGSSVAFVFYNGVVTDFQLPTGTTYSLPARGGSYISGNGLNQRAQVVGQSTPAGANLSHGFLWADGQITDIGVLTGGETGNYSSAIAINDAGRVVCVSSAAGQTQHAFVWAQGVMTDLGTLPGDNRSYATAINNRGEIVGWSASATGIIMGAQHAQCCGNMTRSMNLSDSIPAGSGWILDQATAIKRSRPDRSYRTPERTFPRVFAKSSSSRRSHGSAGTPATPAHEGVRAIIVRCSNAYSLQFRNISLARRLRGLNS